LFIVHPFKRTDILLTATAIFSLLRAAAVSVSWDVRVGIGTSTRFLSFDTRKLHVAARCGTSFGDGRTPASAIRSMR
jgi:hypothetical protein